MKIGSLRGKPILCLDFDGVCHVYSSGWQGANSIPDDAVPGLFEFIERASQHFEIQIFSARSNLPGGIQAMREWFEQQHARWLSENGLANRILPISFPLQKPPAEVSLDDRAITFTGQWPDLDFLLNFKPWHKNSPN